MCLLIEYVSGGDSFMLSQGLGVGENVLGMLKSVAVQEVTYSMCSLGGSLLSMHDF